MIDWAKLLSYIAVLVLSFLLFKSCQSNNELKIDSKELNKKIEILQKQKEKVKTEIVYVQNKTVKAIEKVRPMTTSEIEEYYLKRYGNSQISNDTIAKKNIVELIEKDGCIEELKLTNDALVIEESKGIFKDTIIRKEKRKKNFWKVATVVVGSLFIFAK